MAKKAADHQGRREAEVLGPRVHPLPAVWSGRRRCTASSVCAVSASAEMAHRVRAPRRVEASWLMYYRHHVFAVGPVGNRSEKGSTNT